MKKFLVFWFLVTVLLSSGRIFAEQPPEIEVETLIEASPLERFLVTTSVIKKEQMAADPSFNIGELLEKNLGVISQGVANPKARNEINLRGFDISHIRVYLNGIPLNTPNERQLDFSLIPKEFIRQVEVIRGIAPVYYGADASGGVINLLPRQGSDLPGTALTLQGGSFGYNFYTLSQGISSPATDIFGLAKKEKSGGYTTHTDYDLEHGFFYGLFKMKKDFQAELLFSRTGGEKNLPNMVNLDGSLRRRPSGFWTGSCNWGYQDILLENASFKLKKQNPAGISCSLLLFNHIDNNTLTGWVDAGNPISPPSGSPKQYYQAGVTNYSYWESADSGGNLDFDYRKGKHGFKLGAAAENIRFRQNTNASLSKPRNEWDKDYWSPWSRIQYGGYYLQDEIRFSTRLSLTLGGRVDNCSRSTGIGNFNLNLVWQKGAGTWRLAGGTSTRFPTTRELEGKNGNPNLVPERTVSFEFGYQKKSGDKLLDLAVFSSGIKNLIGVIDNNSPFQNWQKVNLFGFEAGAGFPLGQEILLSLGAQYVCRDFGNQSPVWSGIPRNKYTVSLSSRNMPGRLNWRIESLTLSKRETGEAELPTLSGYTLIDLKLSYRQLSLTVRNLFDTAYRDSVYFPAPGRGVWGEYSLSF